VNLAPPAARKSGPEFDLALACCVLAAQEQIDADRLARVGLFAELGLGGDLRPCASAAAAAASAAQAGLAGLIVARSDLREARGAGTLAVVGLRSLREVATLLAGGAPRTLRRRDPRAAGAERFASVAPPARAGATTPNAGSPRRSPPGAARGGRAP
jgi:predicted ATPase with chaperone activity